MVFDMVPREKKTAVGGGKPSILSVLKFDSEVQDPGRQKANGGGGKKGKEGQRVFFFFTARRVNSPNTLRTQTKVSSLTPGKCLIQRTVRLRVN